MKNSFSRFLALIALLTLVCSFGQEVCQQKSTSYKFKEVTQEAFYAKQNFDEINEGALVDSYSNRKTIYGIDGRVISDSCYMAFDGIVSSTSIYISRYTYDAEGKVVETQMYDINGKLTSKNKNIYNAQGLCTESISYGSTGIERKTISLYDNSGNCTESKDYNSSGVLTYYQKFGYDSKGHQISMKSYDGDGTFRTEIRTNYDPHGNIIQYEFKKLDGTLQSRVAYKYDGNDNCIEETNYDHKGTVTSKLRYTYEIDEKGNWTKKIEYNATNPAVEIPERIYRRTIKYY